MIAQHPAGTAVEQFIHRSRVNAINATTSYRAWLRDVFYRRTELPRQRQVSPAATP